MRETITSKYIYIYIYMCVIGVCMSTERVLFIGTPSVTLTYVPTYHAYQDYLKLSISLSLCLSRSLSLSLSYCVSKSTRTKTACI